MRDKTDDMLKDNTPPKWQFWAARLFGKTIVKKNGYMVKQFRGDTWYLRYKQ